MKRRVDLWTLVILLMSWGILYSQDVPFIWGHHWGVGARAMGMGGAFTGVADDYSAMYYNPAGLGQLKKLEVFGSFSHLSVTNKAAFMGLETSESSSYTKLDGIGVSVPVPTNRGSLVLGFGYHRVRDFDNALYVTKFISSVGDSVTWSYNELVEGGLNNTSFGGSIEMAPGVLLGGTVNFWTGSDDWTWRFTEEDTPHDIWTFTDYVETDYIHTKFTGVNFTLSTLLKPQEIFQLGGVIVTPVTLTSKEDWEYTETTTWDDGYRSADSTDDGYWDYKVRSPWIFRIGGALKPGPLMVSADVEFKNYSQIKYTSYPPAAGYTMTDMNIDIKENLRNTMNWRVGGEFTVPNVDLRIRGGYAVYPSPWEGASSAMDRKVISLGAGYSFQNFVLDVGYGFVSWDGMAGDVIEQEKVEVSKIVFSLLYRM